MSVPSLRLSLYKRPHGIYYVGYYSGGRRLWKTTGVRSKPEALKSLTQFAELLKKPGRHLTLQAFVGEFLGYSQANHAHATVALFRASLERFLLFTGNSPVRDLTSEHLDRYKARRLSEVSSVSVNVELRMLRSAFSTAKRWKLVDSNPCDGVKPAAVPQVAPVFLSQADFERLLACIKEGWFREIVVFAVLTGLRRGEIVNLRWDRVDLSRRVIHIETGPSFKTKQGRRRTVPLSDSALHLLNARHGKSTGEYVFTKDGGRLNEGWVTHLFKRYVRDAKLPDRRLHFHSLRHTFASWLVQNGATLYEVQKLLGHSSAKVTEIYSHLQSEHLFGAVQRIPVAVN